VNAVTNLSEIINRTRALNCVARLSQQDPRAMPLWIIIGAETESQSVGMQRAI